MHQRLVEQVACTIRAILWQNVHVGIVEAGLTSLIEYENNYRVPDILT
jgi:hypothetical protein